MQQQAAKRRSTYRERDCTVLLKIYNFSIFNFTVLRWYYKLKLKFTSSKSTIETVEKGVKYSKLTIQTPERSQ